MSGRMGSTICKASASRRHVDVSALQHSGWLAQTSPKKNMRQLELSIQVSPSDKVDPDSVGQPHTKISLVAHKLVIRSFMDARGRTHK